MRKKRPMVDRDTYLQQHLDLLFSGPCCSWCKDHSRKLYGKRTPLCASCLAIQKRIRKYEKLRRQHRPLSPKSVDRYGFELEVARQMRKSAEKDGSQFGNLNSKNLKELDPEHILCEVSRIAVRRNLFSNLATLLNENFSKPQLRLLYYMMSEIVRAYRCKHRYHVAGTIVSLSPDWAQRVAASVSESTADAKQATQGESSGHRSKSHA